MAIPELWMGRLHETALGGEKTGIGGFVLYGRYGKGDGYGGFVLQRRMIRSFAAA